MWLPKVSGLPSAVTRETAPAKNVRLTRQIKKPPPFGGDFFLIRESGLLLLRHGGDNGANLRLATFEVSLAVAALLDLVQLLSHFDS